MKYIGFAAIAVSLAFAGGALAGPVEEKCRTASAAVGVEGVDEKCACFAADVEGDEALASEYLAVEDTGNVADVASAELLEIIKTCFPDYAAENL
ncbi:MAG: hypothetical protein AAGL49_00190 [Pseudomonadota bacterium]